MKKLLMGIVVISLLASQGPSHASAPMAQTQAPGFYRVVIGDLEVTPLNDGVVPYKIRDVLPTATDPQIQHFLSNNALTDPVGFPPYWFTSLTAYRKRASGVVARKLGLGVATASAGADSEPVAVLKRET